MTFPTDTPLACPPQFLPVGYPAGRYPTYLGRHALDILAAHGWPALPPIGEQATLPALASHNLPLLTITFRDNGIVDISGCDATGTVWSINRPPVDAEYTCRQCGQPDLECRCGEWPEPNREELAVEARVEPEGRWGDE